MAVAHQPFPKIEQFRHVVKDLRHYLESKQISQTIFQLRGTTKLHGLHADIVATWDAALQEYTLMYQSRNCIVTETSDVRGFYQFMKKIPANFLQNLIKRIAERSVTFTTENKIDTTITTNTITNTPLETIMLSGEYCGDNLQNSVALTQLPKMFVIYNIKINDIWQEMTEYNDISLEDYFIYNISRGSIFSATLDINNTEQTVPSLIAITAAVEKECPFAKSFGISGIGEGVVWTIQEFPTIHDFWFKVKGEEHAVSKVKILKITPTEILDKIKNIKDLLPQIVTEARLHQGIDYLMEQNLVINKQNIGVFIKWMINDVDTEEQDTMQELNLDPELVKKEVAVYVRTWYFKQCK